MGAARSRYALITVALTNWIAYIRALQLCVGTVPICLGGRVCFNDKRMFEIRVGHNRMVKKPALQFCKSHIQQILAERLMSVSNLSNGFDYRRTCFQRRSFIVTVNLGSYLGTYFYLPCPIDCPFARSDLPGCDQIPPKLPSHVL